MRIPSPFHHRTLATAAALLLGSLVGTQVEAASTTYTVNETITGPLNGTAGNPTQTNSVVGTITTDGTLGVLHASNILSWDLNLLDLTSPQFSYELTNSNSTVAFDSGSVLSAGTTGLFFNFDSTGIFTFQATSPGAGTGYHYWCLSQGTSICLDGNSIAPDNVFAGSVGDDLVVAATGTQGQIGNSPLDQSPPVTAVPEPSTCALFGLGLAAVAVTRRRAGKAV